MQGNHLSSKPYALSWHTRPHLLRGDVIRPPEIELRLPWLTCREKFGRCPALLRAVAKPHSSPVTDDLAASFWEFHLVASLRPSFQKHRCQEIHMRRNLGQVP